MNPVFIEGLSLGGYRSFGPEAQRIGPCQKVNLLIGPNNSGKSNVLLFLKGPFRSVLDMLGGRRHGPVFDDIDRHIGAGTTKLTFGLATSATSPQLRGTIEEKGSTARRAQRVLSSEALTEGSDLAWFEYETPTAEQRLQPVPSIVGRLQEENVLTYQEWNGLWTTLTKREGGDLESSWIPETLRVLSPVAREYPPVSFVPAIRRISRDSGEDERDLSGAGLIDRLARLERPAYNRQQDKERFRSINRFLRTVTGNSSATLEIPYERDMITVHMDRKSLPLTSLGTGMHEVIILAAAATVVENQIVCIEEPELHLHPLLQRQLIQYLLDHTSNQYFITTHSAHLLETERASVFRVQMVDGQSRVSVASTADHKWAICRDLGYRASDILQANCVIWVEGPSDRIYLRHWIHAMDPDLIEGIHYSIMFYGGRLLRHLSANDPDVEEFISLRRLNRNLVLVADSDKESAHKPINKTKKRVREEFGQGPGFAWITKGREIENYVAGDVLRKAVEAVKPGLGRKVIDQPYAHALPVVNPKAKTPTRVDKVKVAREATRHAAVLDVLDLKQQVTKLVRFIRDCNE